MKNLIRTILLLIAFNQAHAQSDLLLMARTAYLKSSATLWEKVTQIAQSEFDREKSDENLYQLLCMQYGLINATIVEKNEDLFDNYYDKIIDNADKLIESEFKANDAKAVLSATYGLKIVFTPWKGMFLGPKSGYYIDEAIEGGEGSATVQKLMGNYLYFTPETWGGDMQKAVSHYQKSIALFESSGDTQNWLYLDAHAWLGQGLAQLGKKDEAKAVFLKVLEVAPDFRWVSESLLPDLQ